MPPQCEEKNQDALSRFDDTRRRIVIFTDTWDTAATSEHIEAIADEFPHWSIFVIQQVRQPKLSTRLRRKLRLFVRDPLSVTMRALESIKLKLERHRNRGSGTLASTPSLRELRRENLTYRCFRSIHGSEALEYVRSLKPWLGISVGAPILKKSLFDIPELGTINIHKSLLPDYRGMPYAFWELFEGATTTGVSIHWVDEGLDTGPLVLQRAHPIPQYATVGGLATELDVIGTDLLVETLRQIDAAGARVSSTSQAEADGSSTANRPPSWLQNYQLNRRLSARRRPADSLASRLRSVVKTIALWGYSAIYAEARNFYLSCRGKCRVSILLYHRVNDGFLDTVTVGVEQFDKQIEYLSRHYEIIDVPEFLATRGQPRRRPAVVLTFDDGYADNFVAATLLRRRGIPCTFFVSTRIVNTELPFPHDQKALGRALPTLTWDQIRKMRKWGFHIANHTQTHANLGELPLEEAMYEVAEASNDLRAQIGSVSGVSWLAYPYGQRKHMTDTLRNRLPEIGTDHCFSAYGGTNGVDFDRLNIVRQGVDHRFDLLRLRAAIEGWTA